MYKYLSASKKKAKGCRYFFGGIHIKYGYYIIIIIVTSKRKGNKLTIKGNENN